MKPCGNTLEKRGRECGHIKLSAMAQAVRLCVAACARNELDASVDARELRLAVAFLQ